MNLGVRVGKGCTASRMRTRAQISSDALRAYVDAIEQVYGADIEELRDLIRPLHVAEATHVESVALKGTFKGQTIWGIVEVFDLVGHPTSHRAYAWADESDDLSKPAPARHGFTSSSSQIGTGRGKSRHRAGV